jgi:putative ABC transport system permease protein
VISPRYIPLILKQVVRQRARSVLTGVGVAVAMFLFVSVQALQRGVAAATEATGREVTLVVYRQNRYCPFTSRMPESYVPRIARISGVASVVPMKIVVNNCGASLDTVTFRGVPREGEGAERVTEKLRVVSGSIEAWRSRGDAALVGESLAARRRLTAGQTLVAAGVSVYIAAVVHSDEPQEQNVAYVDLAFLQRAATRGGDGIVTQFNVRVSNPAQLETVAKAIDVEFARDAEPTDTRPEKAFVARAAHDLVQIVGFTRYLGWAALAAVLALVGNAIVLSVQDRVKEHAVLQTLGFRGGLIARLIVAEGVTLCVAGGLLGVGAAYAVLHFGHFSMSIEGTSITVNPDLASAAIGLTVAAVVGVLAGMVPAFQASRREIAASFRAV